MSQAPWMIYGANGYTGRLAAELCREQGLTPILAGRSASAIEAMARELQLPSRVFSLDHPAEVRDGLRGVQAVLLTAGPFVTTSRLLLEGCLATGTHYLDITGEIEVFEELFARRDEVAAAGIVAMPGVGFDVVPTDCLALMLHQRLPDATHLELAFAGRGRPSRGTLKTAVAGGAAGGRARIDHRLEPVPMFWKERQVAFPHGRRHVVTIPWGDVCTAWYTTGIPNILTYTAMPRAARRWRWALERLRPMLGWAAVRRGLEQLIDRFVPLADAAERARNFIDVWGEVRNAQGVTVSGALRTPDGYELTAAAAVRATQAVLAGGIVPGVHTPAAALGADFVLQLPGVTLHWLEGQPVDGAARLAQ